MRLPSPLQMFCFTHYSTSLYFLYLLTSFMFTHIYILTKTHRPVALKREKSPDIFLFQVGQGVYQLQATCPRHQTWASLLIKVVFLFFYSFYPSRLDQTFFYSSLFFFFFLCFTGSPQGLAWFWAHLVAFNFHVNCFFNDFSIPSSCKTFITYQTKIINQSQINIKMRLKMQI